MIYHQLFSRQGDRQCVPPWLYIFRTPLSILCLIPMRVRVLAALDSSPQGRERPSVGAAGGHLAIRAEGTVAKSAGKFPGFVVSPERFLYKVALLG